MWEAINTTNLALHATATSSARLRVGPYSVYRYVKERSALFWGLTARTMLRDEASAFLAGGRAHRVGRHGAADAARRAAAGRAERRRSRARRPGARAAAGRRRLPGLPPRGARAAQRAARSRASCSSSAPTRTRSRPRSTRCATRSSAPTPQPRNSEPVLRLRPPRRRPRVPRARAEADDGDLARLCEQRPARARAASTATSPSATSPARGRPHRCVTTMNFAIRYLTEYRYDAPVTDNLNALRVRPGDDLDAALRRVPRARRPRGARCSRHVDYFGTEVIEFGDRQARTTT